MKDILHKLVNHETLTRLEAKECLVQLTQQTYVPEQLAAMLMAIQMRGITVDELIGFRDAVLETGVSLNFAPFETLDIVGTGGDQKNTFNISTCSCFVVAGAGYKVTKHGNYASTSTSGASNVIEAFGVKFTNDQQQLQRSVEVCGFAYLHAPLFASALKYVAPVRKALQIPTCFNLLGPLVNPCQPKYQLLGVANLSQMRLYSNVYQKLGIHYGIVNSIDGYDEISLTSDFKGITNSSERVLSAKSLGLKITSPSELYGGATKEEAAQLFERIMKNDCTPSQKYVVLANSAYAIQILEPNKQLEECVEIARHSLESGAALRVLKTYISLNS